MTVATNKGFFHRQYAVDQVLWFTAAADNLEDLKSQEWVKKSRSGGEINAEMAR